VILRNLVLFKSAPGEPNRWCRQSIEVVMNQSWNKHIQLILDSWQHWDNFSWVWDPFSEKYPKFSAEQKLQVDDA
jgi:hypothetical protein